MLVRLQVEYRLYRAAFARTPDMPGVAYHIMIWKIMVCQYNKSHLICGILNLKRNMEKFK